MSLAAVAFSGELEKRENKGNGQFGRRLKIAGKFQNNNSREDYSNSSAASEEIEMNDLFDLSEER